MQERLVGLRVAREHIVLRGDVPETCAEREHKIATLERRHLRRRVREVQVTDVERIIVGKDIVATEREQHRQLPVPREGEQGLPPIRGCERAASNHQRPLAGRKPCANLVERGFARNSKNLRTIVESRPFDGLLLYIFRQHEHDGPGHT